MILYIVDLFVKEVTLDECSYVAENQTIWVDDSNGEWDTRYVVFTQIYDPYTQVMSFKMIVNWVQTERR